MGAPSKGSEGSEGSEGSGGSEGSAHGSGMGEAGEGRGERGGREVKGSKRKFESREMSEKMIKTGLGVAAPNER